MFWIVTHDIGIGRSTDRIVRMVDGRIVEDERVEVRDVLRVTLFTLDTVRLGSTPQSSASTSWCSGLRDQPGYEGVYVLAWTATAGAESVGDGRGRTGGLRTGFTRGAAGEVRHPLFACPGGGYDVVIAESGVRH